MLDKQVAIVFGVAHRREDTASTTILGLALSGKGPDLPRVAGSAAARLRCADSRPTWIDRSYQYWYSVAVADAEKRVPLVFFRTDAGSEPVREWLLELPKADRRIIGVGLKDVEFGWPIGMPLCRALGGGLFELRVSLRSRRIARVIVCVHDEELFALHGFIKKTQKTRDGDLKLARSRKRQLEKTR